MATTGLDGGDAGSVDAFATLLAKLTSVGLASEGVQIDDGAVEALAVRLSSNLVAEGLTSISDLFPREDAERPDLVEERLHDPTLEQIPSGLAIAFNAGRATQRLADRLREEGTSLSPDGLATQLSWICPPRVPPFC